MKLMWKLEAEIKELQDKLDESEKMREEAEAEASALRMQYKKKEQRDETYTREIGRECFTLEKQLEAAEAREANNTKIAYRCGYDAGHHDTVESQYGDPEECAADWYQEACADGTLDTSPRAEAIQRLLEEVEEEAETHLTRWSRRCGCSFCQAVRELKETEGAS